jgi:hypothetical protein
MKRYDSLLTWVSAFERWSGLKIDMDKSVYKGPRGTELFVTTSTGLCITKMTVYESSTDGWRFGAVEGMFSSTWVQLCDGDF